MTSNTKSREPRIHVVRPEYYRRPMVAVPIIPVKVSPEMANAIRRRDGQAGVDYWDQVITNGMVARPVRRMTVEQAFPRMYANGQANIERIPSNTAIRAREPSRKPQKSPNHTGLKHQDKAKSLEPKKATATDLGSFQNGVSDDSRNYQAYSANVRYVENDLQRSTITMTNDRGSKGSRTKESKSEDFSVENGHKIPLTVAHTTTKGENNLAVKASRDRATPNGGAVTKTGDNYRSDKIKPYKYTWSEMAHLSVNGSLARMSEPTFQKIGMNHTFRIPRPKAVTDPRSSVAHRRISLTASKKRGVRFGQDKVYEYTPLEPVNNIPIHEELL